MFFFLFVVIGHSSDLDDLLGLGGGSSAPAQASGGSTGLEDLFGSTSMSAGSTGSSGGYVAPPQVWLTAQKGKGLEISGTFARRNGQMFMGMTLSNRAMTPMAGFAIQFNKNSFGLTPAQQLNVPPVQPQQASKVSLQLATGGAVLKTDPINLLQVQHLHIRTHTCPSPLI